MVDEHGQALPCHLGAAADPDTDANCIPDAHKLISAEVNSDSIMFIRHLLSPRVQEVVKARRPDEDSWLRCVGLKRHNTGRRDDAMWKKEIELRIECFLERNSTPLQKRDFDFRVKRFLHEFCVHSAVFRVSEALAMVESSTAGKNRDDVRSWPAYIATLLRRFDPRLYDALAERDKRSRFEQRRQRQDLDHGQLDHEEVTRLRLLEFVSQPLPAELRAHTSRDFDTSSKSSSPRSQCALSSLSNSRSHSPEDSRNLKANVDSESKALDDEGDVHISKARAPSGWEFQ